MRGTVIFLLAIALGALTVSGQDGGNADDLRRRIRELSDELKRRADERSTRKGEQGRVVLRVHEIGDLLTVRSARRGGMVDLVPSRFASVQREEPEPNAIFELDAIIELIRSVVEPPTWDEIENVDIQPRHGALFINQIPRVQRKVAALLDQLRAFTQRQMRVRFVAVPVEKGDLAMLDAAPRELDAAQATQLLAREPLGVAEIVCDSGQRLSQRIGRRVSYLQDYDVEIAQEATIGDPIRREGFSGLAVELEAMLDDGGNGARLDFEVVRTHLASPIRRVDTEHGPLELPVLELSRLMSSAWVPLGKPCVVGGSTGGADPCLFVVTVTRMGAK